MGYNGQSLCKSAREISVKKRSFFNSVYVFLFARYFSLYSSCIAKADHKDLSYIESALGYEYTRTDIHVKFLENVERQTECTLDLAARSKDFHQAITAQYWYQLYVDGLPVWGLVGERVHSDENKKDAPGNSDVDAYIYTHRDIRIGHDGNHVTEVIISPSGLVKVDPEKGSAEDVPLTYSVKWFKSALGYSERSKYYQDKSFFEHKVHRYASINSVILSVFLVCIVWAVKSHLTGDSSSSSSSSSSASSHHKDAESVLDLEAQAPAIISDGDDSWRKLSGDVTRGAGSLGLFCALIGAGAHLLAVAAAVLVLLVSSSSSSSIVTSGGYIAGRCLVWYTIFSVVNGFFSGKYYYSAGGKAWMRAGLVTAALFPTLVGVLWTLSSIAAWGSNAAVGASFAAWTEGGILWALCILPLTYLGIVIGRSVAINTSPSGSVGSASSAQKRISVPPSIVPPKAWYESAPCVFFASGILPFGSIAVELYFVFASLWNYKMYYTFAYALVGLAAFVVVASCVAVLVVYFTLCTEDYRWQWASVLPGLAAGLYTLLYSLYYYTVHTVMLGFLQTAIFYALSFGISAVVGLVGAFAGFTAASWFINEIYTQKKMD